MENTQVNKDKLKAIIKEAILNEMRTNESFASRVGAAWDTAKDKMLGIGDGESIRGSWKKEKAFDLYKKYRALFTKANQMKPQVNKKANAAFAASNGGYAAAKQLALSENEIKQLHQAIKESLTDEGFWSGLKNVGRNFGQSMRNGNGIAGKFHNMQNDYHQGDAAGDALSYSNLMGEVNRAKAAFVRYCRQNGFDPKAIAQEYKSSVRQDVISGQNKSRVAANVATDYGKSKIRTAGPSAKSLNASRTKLQQQRNQTNQARVWENTDEQDCK